MLEKASPNPFNHCAHFLEMMSEVEDNSWITCHLTSNSSNRRNGKFRKNLEFGEASAAADRRASSFQFCKPIPHAERSQSCSSRIAKRFAAPTSFHMLAFDAKRQRLLITSSIRAKSGRSSLLVEFSGSLWCSLACMQIVACTGHLP